MRRVPKRILVTTLLLPVAALLATSPKHGEERLRELAVVPKMDVSFGIGSTSIFSTKEAKEESEPAERIAKLQAALKKERGDLQKQMELGRLLTKSNETNAATECFKTAEQFCRKTIEQRPQDGLVWDDLGEVLSEMARYDEAESAYRKATVLSPTEWKCWAGLGKFLDSHSLRVLFPAKPVKSLDSFQEWLDAGMFVRPSAEALAQSAEFIGEAAKCFDRAVALAPKEPRALLERANHHGIAEVRNTYSRLLRGEETLDKRKLPFVFVSQAAALDIKRAARLSPGSYQLIGTATSFEFLAAKKQSNSEDFTSDDLSDSTLESIRTAMSHLEELGQSPDKKLSAGALETLGFLKMLVYHDVNGLKDSARRAVALDPTREQSWDMLLGGLAQSGTPDELVGVCETRLKHKDSARNHLLLSKALALQEKWSRATEQANAAVKLETNNVPARIMLVALGIRCGAETNSPLAVKDHLSVVTEQLKAMPPDEEWSLRRREAALNLAILCGLHGEVKNAKELLDNVLRENPDDEVAKEILAALQ